MTARSKFLDVSPPSTQADSLRPPIAPGNAVKDFHPSYNRKTDRSRTRQSLGDCRFAQILANSATRNASQRCAPWRRGGAVSPGGGTLQLRRRGGFTLVEFLVASLLAVILMATLTGLLNAVWRQSKVARRVASDYPATWLLEEQVRRDLTNARYFQIVPRGVRLGGFLSTESTSGEPTFRHAMVAYEVVTSSGDSRLVRVEQALGNVASPPRVELLWVGASAVNLVPLAEPLQSERSRFSTKYRDMAALPQDLLFIVREEDGGIVCSTRVTSHRGT